MGACCGMPHALQRGVGAPHHGLAATARLGLALQQEAELKDIRAAFPEYAAIHSHVLQDVLARLDKTYQAFFLRVRHGERAGFPRFRPATRYNSFTYKEYGNGAMLDNGFLVLSKIGRIAVRWSRPLEGTPKTVTISREADGWYLCVSCVDVPMQALPATGRKRGSTLGLRHSPRCRTAHASFTLAGIAKPSGVENRATARFAPQKGSNRKRKAVALLAKAHKGAGDSGRTFTTRQRWARSAHDAIDHETCSPPTW